MATQYYIYIDWDDNGTFTDEGGRVIRFNIQRGKRRTVEKDGYAHVNPGMAYLTLDNYDGRYDPFNTSGELYGYILPNRVVRIKATDGTLTYNLFTGFIRDVRPQRGFQGRSEAQIVCSDGLDWLQEQNCEHGDVQTDYLVNEAINDLTVAAGWPFADTSGWIFPMIFETNSELGGTGIENNGDTMPYWWSDPKKTVLEAINELENTWAGNAFVATDGTFSYEARIYGLDPKVTITQSELLKDMELQQPWEEIKNRIRIGAHPRRESGSIEIWRLSDIPYIGASGTLTIWAEYQDEGEWAPAKSVTTPVATTDYTANTEEGGGGADKTAQISISMTDYATEAKLEITNNDAGGVYLTLMKLRGELYQDESKTFAIESDTVSINDYGRRDMTVNEIWTQESQEAADHAGFAIYLYADPRKVPWIRFEERPTYQFAYDLFDGVVLDIDKLGIDGDYYITYIEHDWQATRGCRTTWRLEPDPEDVLGYWIFPATFETNTILGW